MLPLYFVTLLLLFKFGIQAEYQHSFQKPETQPVTLTLKTIYHHSSPNGPIPRLFRRLDINQQYQQQYHQHLRPSSLNVSPIVGQYEKLSQPAKNFLIQRSTTLSTSSYQPKRIRWKHLTSLTPFNNDLLKEPTWGLIPDVTHRPTILTLGLMTNNAYFEADNRTDWFDLGAPWRLNSSFGWESDGVRGHVFGNQDDSLLVISFKGTSVGVLKNEPTGEKDRINDNMLFSCCCARISRAWSPVCDCYQGNEYICESECLEKNILKTEFYYDHAMAIYLEVANQYPDATIWLTGHSLGGSLASLVGQTFGIPTISFEAPGDQLASNRLHLPHYKNMPLWHFGHTADPIFVGVCTGPSSSCWYGGFAMESRCHTGKMCVWDTIHDNGWRLDSRTHRILDVIENILNKTEEFPLPNCKKEVDCADCGLWHYDDRRDGNHTITPTATSTQTATEPPDDPWAFIT